MLSDHHRAQAKTSRKSTGAATEDTHIFGMKMKYSRAQQLGNFSILLLWHPHKGKEKEMIHSSHFTTSYLVTLFVKADCYFLCTDCL